MSLDRDRDLELFAAAVDPEIPDDASRRPAAQALLDRIVASDPCSAVAERDAPVVTQPAMTLAPLTVGRSNDSSTLTEPTVVPHTRSRRRRGAWVAAAAAAACVAVAIGATQLTSAGDKSVRVVITSDTVRTPAEVSTTTAPAASSTTTAPTPTTAAVRIIVKPPAARSVAHTTPTVAARSACYLPLTHSTMQAPQSMLGGLVPVNISSTQRSPAGPALRAVALPAARAS